MTEVALLSIYELLQKCTNKHAYTYESMLLYLTLPNLLKWCTNLIWCGCEGFIAIVEVCEIENVRVMEGRRKGGKQGPDITYFFVYLVSTNCIYNGISFISLTLLHVYHSWLWGG